MNKEYSVVQVTARKYAANDIEDIVPLYPSGQFFFHVPGDPLHAWQKAIRVADGIVTFLRPLYLFNVTAFGNSFDPAWNCYLASEIHDAGIEQTFRHMGHQLQGVTDLLLNKTPMRRVNFCAVIETVGFEHPEAGWITESQFKGWLNLRDQEDILKACSPVPTQFEANP